MKNFEIKRHVGDREKERETEKERAREKKNAVIDPEIDSATSIISHVRPSASGMVEDVYLVRSNLPLSFDPIFPGDLHNFGHSILSMPSGRQCQST